MDDQKILGFLKTNGPTLPAQLAKFLESNILLSSARLSELVSRRLVLVSKLKVGGSPLYYLPGEEEKLLNFKENLNPKDQETLLRLQQEKIFQENAQDLFTKVSVRKLDDFAKALKVTRNGSTEIFWKWYMVNDDEAKRLINSLLEVPKSTQPASPPIQQEVKPALSEPIPKPVVEMVQQTQTVPVTKPIPVQIPIERSQSIPEPVRQPPKQIEPTVEIKSQPIQQRIVEPKKGIVAEAIETIKKKLPKRQIADELFPKTEEFFNRKKIVVESKETIRKNAEINLIIRVPTAVGGITYFCKVKDKKRCDDKDLSSAYMEGQMKKLPTILLYTNELHKKATELLDSGMFTNLQALQLQWD